MTITPNCAYCTRFHSEQRETDTCEAFPNGIPAAIIRGEHGHLEPYPGDRGLRFDPKPGFEYIQLRKE